MLANAERLDAEEKLRRGGAGTPEAVGRLVALATDDEEQGKLAAAEAYRRQLIAKVEADCAQDPH